MKKIFPVLLIFLIINISPHAQTIITGKVSGINGRHLLRADVHLVSPLADKIISSRRVNKNGNYSIKIYREGYFSLQFTGVDYHRMIVPIIVKGKGKIKLNVELKHNRYLKTFKKVQIIGDFNNFNVDHPVTMKKQPNGTYTAEFKTNKRRFSYQIGGIEYSGRIINGTDATSYIYDGDGDYESVVIPRNGKVEITFDPKKLVRVHNKGEVNFSPDEHYAKKVYELVTDMRNRQIHYNELLSKHKSKKPLRPDWLPDIAKVQNAYRVEKDPRVGRLLLISYLQFGILGATALNDSVVAEAFKKIKPTSSLWSIAPKTLEMGYGFGRFKGRPGYVNDVIKNNPDRQVRAYALYIKVYRARFVGNKKLVSKLLHTIVTKYGDTKIGKTISRAMRKFK